MEAKVATVNGVRVSYGESEPNGPHLVFLTGFPDRWEDYQPLLEDLGRDFHVFSPSMRGMGRSGHAAPYRVSDWVSDVAGFVRDAVGAPALGVGHSAGAWFGLSAAGRDPKLFGAAKRPEGPRSEQRSGVLRLDQVNAHSSAVTPSEAALPPRIPEHPRGLSADR